MPSLLGPRMRRALAWTLWMAGLVVVALGALSTSENAWALASLGLGGVAFGVVGLALALRTRFVTGWLFLAIQLSTGLTLGEWSGSGTDLILLIAAVLLTFPEGRLPSKRWWVAAIGLGLAALGWVLFDLLRLGGPAEDYSWLAFMIIVFPVMAASALRIVIDFVKARGDTRQQLKWLAWVLALGGVVLAISMIPIPVIDDAHELAGLILLIGSPVAVGLAVTKYRLYEVDRVISRTVAYSIVVLSLGLAYAVVVTLVGLQFHSSLAVAASTLTVAALFSPLRKRVQIWVDRRFNRSKYDAESILVEFARSLNDRVEVQDLASSWSAVVSETMHPSHISVWVRSS